MLRWLRFGFYAVILGAVLASNAPALRAAVRILLSRDYFAPEPPALGLAVAILLLAGGYALWLSGATVAGWRMPLLTHVVPIGLAILLVGRGPLEVPAAGAEPPADRAIRALKLLAARAGGLGASPCAAGRALEQLLADEPGLPGPGFRDHGRARPWSLRVHPEADGPVREPRGAAPGTLHLACDRAGRRFWLTAVVTERLPAGPASMVRDGVGRVAVFSGEVLQ